MSSGGNFLLDNLSKKGRGVGNSYVGDYDAIGQESQDRQKSYSNLLKKLEKPGDIQRMQAGEQMALDSLQRQASGDDRGVASLLGEIENARNARGFAQQASRASMAGNPMGAVSGVNNLAMGSLSGSEARNAQNILQERLGAQQSLLKNAQNIENRDYALGEKLREDFYQAQRDAANLASEERGQMNQQEAARERVNKAYQQYQLNNKIKTVGALGGGIMSAIAKISDENTKKQMKPAGTTIDIILKKIEPTEYEYKNKYKDDPRAGKGKQVGVLAQDLEDAGAGFAVSEDPKTGMKMVDVVSLVPMLLAGQSHLNAKIERLEKGKKK